MLAIMVTALEHNMRRYGQVSIQNFILETIQKHMVDPMQAATGKVLDILALQTILRVFQDQFHTMQYGLR